MEVTAYMMAVVVVVLSIVIGVIGLRGHYYLALWLGCIAICLAIIGATCWLHDYWAKGEAKPSAKAEPIGLSATASRAKQPIGAVIAGIDWRPSYREVRLSIANVSDATFQNIDLVVRPDQPVAAAGQATDVPGVSIGWHEMPTFSPEAINTNTNERIAIPMVPLASRRGFRVHCNSLPAKSRLEIVFAAVALSKPEEFNKDADVLAGVLSADYWACLSHDDGFNVWFGKENHTDAVFSDPPEVTSVAVAGEYSVAERIVPVSATLPAFDPVEDALKLKLFDRAVNTPAKNS
jgi:hypothetical protein